MPSKPVCEMCLAQPATVLCCAEEAAYCADCDTSKHCKGAAGHDRLPFSAGTLPSCDICQVAGALVFCKDDRALVCRRCDIAIHSATALSQKHERFFLLGGARVALQSLPDPTGADASTEAAPLAKRTRAQFKATAPQTAQPATSESSDTDLQLVPTLDDAFMNMDVNSWVFSQEPAVKKQKTNKGMANAQSFGDMANFFFGDLESTEFADADILADWEVPDINKPQRRARADLAAESCREAFISMKPV